jgi:hypothetical protein
VLSFAIEYEPEAYRENLAFPVSRRLQKTTPSAERPDRCSAVIGREKNAIL